MCHATMCRTLDVVGQAGRSILDVVRVSKEKQSMWHVVAGRRTEREHRQGGQEHKKNKP
jgi:hypothetical protein